MKWKQHIQTYIACTSQFNYENQAQNNLPIKTPTYIPFERKEETEKRKFMIGLLYFFKMDLWFFLTLPFIAN